MVDGVPTWPISTAAEMGANPGGAPGSIMQPVLMWVYSLPPTLSQRLLLAIVRTLGPLRRNLLLKLRFPPTLAFRTIPLITCRSLSRIPPRLLGTDGPCRPRRYSMGLEVKEMTRQLFRVWVLLKNRTRLVRMTLQ